MRLNILEATDEMQLVLMFVVFGALGAKKNTKPDLCDEGQTGETAKPKDDLAAEKAANSADSDQSGTSTGEQPRWRRILSALAFIEVVFTVYFTFCIAFLLPSYGKDFFEKDAPSFTKHTDLPLFYVTFFFFIWILAALLKWRRLSQFERTVLRSPWAYAAVWVACAIIQLNGSSFLVIALYPFFEDVRDIDHRVFSHLHVAYEQSLAGKIVFWTLVGMVGTGVWLTQMTFIATKVSSAVIFAVFSFTQLRQPCWQYLIRPLYHLVKMPLSLLSSIVLAPLGSVLYRCMLSPFVRAFPGPSTNAEHAFPKPPEPVIILTFVGGSVFTSVTSAIIFTASEDDEHLWQEKSRRDIWIQLGIFYSMVLWLIWQGASALNFAPAVRLEGRVYASRLGWTLQGLIPFPWLYSLWRMAQFTWYGLGRDEGTVHHFLESVQNFGSVTIAGWELLSVGSILEQYLKGCTITGFKLILVVVVIAMWVCLRQAYRVVRQYPSRLYKPEPSIPEKE